MTQEQRQELIVARRLEGATLQQVGDEFRISRERVRQICVKAGLNRETVKAANKARELAASDLLEVSAREDLLSHPGTTLQESAKRQGVPVSTLRTVITPEMSKLFVRRNRSGSAGTDWTRARIIEVLVEAETLAFPLTASSYDELVSMRIVDGPSGARIHQVFGGWHAACDAAGVECGRPRPGGYSSKWTDADLVAAAARYLEDGSSTGTFADFDRWLRGETDLPSAQTVRNRLGPWSEVKTAAVARQSGREFDDQVD
jgi:hypothetical protein